jgi:hypothetical protein
VCSVICCSLNDNLDEHVRNKQQSQNDSNAENAQKRTSEVNHCHTQNKTTKNCNCMYEIKSALHSLIIQPMSDEVTEEVCELFSLSSKRFAMWCNEQQQQQNEQRQLLTYGSSGLAESTAIVSPLRTSSLSPEQHEEYIRLLRKSQAAENVDDARMTNAASSASGSTSNTVLTMSEVAKFGALEIAVRDEQRLYHALKYAEVLRNTQLHCYLDSRVELHLTVLKEKSFSVSNRRVLAHSSRTFRSTFSRCRPCFVRCCRICTTSFTRQIYNCSSNCNNCNSRLMFQFHFRTLQISIDW